MPAVASPSSGNEHLDRDLSRRHTLSASRVVHTHTPVHDPFVVHTNVPYDPVPTSNPYSHPVTHPPMPERIFPPSSLSLSFPAQFPSPAAVHYHHPLSRNSTSPQGTWAYPAHTQWVGSSNIAQVNVSVNVPPPPPQVAHKVWLLDCKNCLTFLTNRGMKAVLLLRPHVPLYSTDALPINCSAYSATPTPVLPSRAPSADPPRTCECLTQTLCCHGCGNGVGYMIVIPCARCTSSISATNRATNGHRFVFHSTEIVASERHYIPDEPGVLPFYTDPSPAPPPVSPPPFLPSSTSRELPIPIPPWESSFRSLTPSPPLSPVTPGDSPASMPSLVSSSALAPQSPFPVVSAAFVDPLKPGNFPLRAGDVLYWHQLARNGEIPGVAEDKRARGKRMGFAFDR